MKYIIYLLCFFGIGCNSQQKTIENQKAMEEYFVYQIDTIDDYYLVYAKKEDMIFKIVSKKEEVEKCSLIKVNNSYYFDLYAESSIKPVIDGKEIDLVSIIDVMCYNFGNGTKICTDRKNHIYDLYYARNLKGLCLK